MVYWPGDPDMPFDKVIEQDEAANAAGKPIKHVIFDFGNVLITWDPAAALLPRYDKSIVEQFLDNNVSGFYDYNDLTDEGASLDEVVARMRAEKGDKWADIYQYYLDNFEDTLTGVVPGSRALVRDLQEAGIGTWGLSNWESVTFAQADRYCPVLKALDDRVVSGFVNMRKPNLDIYQYALEKFGIEAQDCIFLDDKAMNIIAANKCGIRGIRFSNAQRAREILIELGVSIPSVITELKQ